MQNWIAVASANHVAIGRAGGFAQVNHGKIAPLQRMKPGDRIAYYSPAETMGGKDRLQSFTAFGTVAPGEPYQGVMGQGFVAWRRDILWQQAEAAPIAPLLAMLDFTAGQTNWGYKFRFGLFTVTDADMDLIAAAMKAVTATSAPAAHAI